jgi:hypothetical protein
MKTEGRTGIAQDKSDHARKHERRAGPTSWATNRDPGLKTETKACTGGPLSREENLQQKIPNQGKEKTKSNSGTGRAQI